MLGVPLKGPLTKYEKIYNNLSAIFWFWIPLGFISIPIWFGFIARVI